MYSIFWQDLTLRGLDREIGDLTMGDKAEAQIVQNVRDEVRIYGYTTSE